MRKTLLTRLAMGASVLAVLAAPIVNAMPAHAVLPSGQDAVAAAGSDTTEKVMTGIMQDLDNRTINGHTVRAYNIPASPAAYDNNTTGVSNHQYHVEGDANCADVNWVKDPLAPGSNTAATEGTAPFGSGAGKKYLVAQNAGTVSGQSGSACVDIARSSSGPGVANPPDGQNLASFEYYAFAMDAVGWATTSLKAPGTLTRKQITDIYDCNVTNWDQLPGGVSGPIQRYFPQLGSGTRSFFISDILVGKPGSYAPPTVAQNSACPTDPILIEENEATAVANADLDKAILPYSAAVWSYHAQNSINPTIDRRNGARLGGITTTTDDTSDTSTAVIKASPVRWDSVGRKYRLDTTAASGCGTPTVGTNPCGVVKETNVKQEIGSANFNEANGNYPGIRFVYNVLDNSRASYSDAFALVGFNNISGGVKSPLCDATSSGTGATEFALILQFGFAPLNNTGGGTANNAGATCRKYLPS